MTFDVAWIFESCKQETNVDNDKVDVELKNPFGEGLVWKYKQKQEHEGGQDKEDIEDERLKILRQLYHWGSYLAARNVKWLFA